MSSTGRGRTRVKNDFYSTPESVADQFYDMCFPHYEFIADDHGHFVIDPCAGSGSLLRPAKRRGYEVKAIEVRKEEEDALNLLCGGHSNVTIGSAFDPMNRKLGSFLDNFCVGNPPYGENLDLYLERWAYGWRYSAQLLRLNFAGGVGRVVNFTSKGKRPSDIWVLSQRPVFVWTCRTKGCTSAPVPPGTTEKCPECGDRYTPGNDSGEFAWFVWQRGWTEDHTRFHWLPPHTGRAVEKFKEARAQGDLFA